MSTAPSLTVVAAFATVMSTDATRPALTFFDDATGDRTELSGPPLAMPFRPGPPDGTLDYAVQVRGYGDHFNGPPITADTAAYASGVSHGELVEAARALPVPAGSRVLIDGDAVTDPVVWLVAPLL